MHQFVREMHIFLAFISFSFFLFSFGVGNNLEQNLNNHKSEIVVEMRRKQGQTFVRKKRRQRFSLSLSLSLLFALLLCFLITDAKTFTVLTPSLTHFRARIKHADCPHLSSLACLPFSFFLQIISTRRLFLLFLLLSLLPPCLSLALLLFFLFWYFVRIFQRFLCFPLPLSHFLFFS